MCGPTPSTTTSGLVDTLVFIAMAKMLSNERESQRALGFKHCLDKMRENKRINSCRGKKSKNKHISQTQMPSVIPDGKSKLVNQTNGKVGGLSLTLIAIRI